MASIQEVRSLTVNQEIAGSIPALPANTETWPSGLRHSPAKGKSESSRGSNPLVSARRGGLAEWSMAAVLKTEGRKVRGFESYTLLQTLQGLRYDRRVVFKDPSLVLLGIIRLSPEGALTEPVRCNRKAGKLALTCPFDQWAANLVVACEAHSGEGSTPKAAHEINSWREKRFVI